MFYAITFSYKYNRCLKLQCLPQKSIDIHVLRSFVQGIFVLENFQNVSLDVKVFTNLLYTQWEAGNINLVKLL